MHDLYTKKHLIFQFLLRIKNVLKGLSVIVNSKLHFFPNPQIFWHIQRELQYNNLPIQQFSRKQHIFGKRDNSLLLGINFRRRKLIQASVSSKKLFKFRFS